MGKGLPENYINRELSWMDFNERVLEEATDVRNPIFERLKFLAITASNLDEFLMVRVGSLIDQINGNYNEPDFAGLTPTEQFDKLSKRIKEFISKQYIVWNDYLRVSIEEKGVEFLKHHEQLTLEEKNYANNYFMENIFPVLTPMAVDSSRPFPLVLNGALNIGALVSKTENGEIDFVTVELPKCLPRLLVLPNQNNEGEKLRVILLEEIIEMNISKLFEKYNILCVHPYRITRNADLTINEDEASDLLKEVEDQVRKRKWGEVIRLEVERNMDERLLDFLISSLKCGADKVIQIPGAIDLKFLNEIYKLKGFEEYKYEPFVPKQNPNVLMDSDIFGDISSQDILLSHPYETFDPVIKLIKSASEDENVLAIKQTLYRVSGKSPIIAALETAALNGKQVTVLVELKARFDEEHNILWARKLERAGAHVIYGLKGLKTHSKITLIVRKEKDKIKRYVHLGTGNYNDTTAKLYTDLGLLTCRKEIGEDATSLFNMMSGYNEPSHWNSLVIAPLDLRDKITTMIRREASNALDGKKAKIVMKMNSLCDRKMIDELYKASQAGVKIKLLVRGICSLKAGVMGLSENIKVRSIVGRYLEHSRIYYFYNDGKEDIYLASADLMPRNLNRRVEIMFPIYNNDLKDELKHHLTVLFSDNIKARQMNEDGTYNYVKNDKSSVCAQEVFMKEASKRAPKLKKLSSARSFVPIN